MPSTAKQLKIPGDYRMAKSFLLPSEEEGGGVALKGIKNRLLELFRKFRTGRRLYVDEEWGIVILVPSVAYSITAVQILKTKAVIVQGLDHFSPKYAVIVRVLSN